VKRLGIHLEFRFWVFGEQLVQSHEAWAAQNNGW
jgi:hypothetical protein